MDIASFTPEQASARHLPIMVLVANVLNEYRADSKRSLHQISVFTKIPKTYIYNLADEEVSEECADPLRLYQILNYIFKDATKALSILEQNDKWKTVLTLWLGRDSKNETRLISDENVEQFLIEENDGLGLLAFSLASNTSGTTKEQLNEVGGSSLVKSAQNLLELGVLIKDNEAIKTKFSESNSGVFSYSRNALKRLSSLVLPFYRSDRAGKGRNWLFLGTEGVNDKFLKKAQAKAQEFRKWYDEESNKKENQGQNPAFFLFVIDTFTEKLTPPKVIEGEKQ